MQNYGQAAIGPYGIPQAVINNPDYFNQLQQQALQGLLLKGQKQAPQQANSSVDPSQLLGLGKTIWRDVAGPAGGALNAAGGWLTGTAAPAVEGAFGWLTGTAAPAIGTTVMVPAEGVATAAGLSHVVDPTPFDQHVMNPNAGMPVQIPGRANGPLPSVSGGQPVVYPGIIANNAGG